MGLVYTGVKRWALALDGAQVVRVSSCTPKGGRLEPLVEACVGGKQLHARALLSLPPKYQKKFFLIKKTKVGSGNSLEVNPNPTTHSARKLWQVMHPSPVIQ